MKFRQLNEALDWVLLVNEPAKATPEEVNRRLRAVVERDSTFIAFLQMAFNEDAKIEGLPPGMPSTYKPEKDMPDGVADTTAKQELRRIRNFQKGGAMLGQKPHRRETVWLQLMEGMHWKEAAVVVAIKDQRLPSLYPNIDILCNLLGLPCINKEVEAEPETFREYSPEDMGNDQAFVAQAVDQAILNAMIEEAAKNAVETTTNAPTPVTNTPSTVGVTTTVEQVEKFIESEAKPKAKRGRKKKATSETPTE